MPRRSYERTVDTRGLVRELLALNHGRANSDMLEALTIELREQHRVRHHHEVGALLEVQWQLASRAAWQSCDGVGPNEWRNATVQVAGLDSQHRAFVPKDVAEYSAVVHRYVREPWVGRVVRGWAADRVA